MSAYKEILWEAVIFFPFVSALITLPFLLIQYHKFGSVSFLKALILYSFVLYFLSAYFLVILPLPSIEAVEAMTSPRVQLMPFKFVQDFINETPLVLSDTGTYKAALLENSFYVPAFNFLLTLPFGVYLTYYFNCSGLQVTFFSFCLSLFYELTQLSGLYFIYPRGYRLFDVDDLFMNTVGGLLGYILFSKIARRLPQREQINAKAYRQGQHISGIRRTLGFCIDLFIMCCFIVYFEYYRNVPIGLFKLTLIAIGIFYIALPILFRGYTIGQWTVKIKVVDNKGKPNFIRLIVRRLMFIFLYIIAPATGVYLGAIIFRNDALPKKLRLVALFTFCILVLLTFGIAVIKYIFTGKKLLYEKISGTKLISTITPKAS